MGREAKRIGGGALFRSHSEAGRSKDSPPAFPEGRMQMGAIEAQVHQDIPDNIFPSDKECGVAAGKPFGQPRAMLPFDER